MKCNEGIALNVRPFTNFLGLRKIPQQECNTDLYLYSTIKAKVMHANSHMKKILSKFACQKGNTTYRSVWLFLDIMSAIPIGPEILGYSYFSSSRKYDENGTKPSIRRTQLIKRKSKKQYTAENENKRKINTWKSVNKTNSSASTWPS